MEDLPRWTKLLNTIRIKCEKKPDKEMGDKNNSILKMASNPYNLTSKKMEKRGKK